MKFGAHISAAGGAANAPTNAASINCEVFQFFTRPPQGGPAATITPKTVKDFKEACKNYQQAEAYVHAPYFINFASGNSRVRYGSISVIREELERCSLLGVKYLMTHLGSAKDLGRTPAIKQTIEGLIKVLEDYEGTTELLIENSAGSGEIIGDEFEEIGTIIKGILKKLPKAEIGVCLDTCHSFASGYDWRNKAAIEKTLKTFDQKIGLKFLNLMHLNDSLTELNSKKDRHADLGDGKIGKEGITAIVRNSKLKKVNMILETPSDEKRKRDIKFLKHLRDS
ncbi:MAG: deoxyribonuclease IV [Patescibacteria group bacterium]|jgi:deoxyribonuclease-4